MQTYTCSRCSRFVHTVLCTGPETHERGQEDTSDDGSRIGTSLLFRVEIYGCLKSFNMYITYFLTSNFNGLRLHGVFIVFRYTQSSSNSWRVFELSSFIFSKICLQQTHLSA